MTCRSCAAEIDDKAIVCYRCGAPTADASVRRTGRVAADAGRWWIGLVVVVVLTVAAYFLFRAAT